RNMRKIIASGSERAVYNRSTRGAPYSIVAPPILFEELELASIESEPEREPILAPPHARETTDK
ncbi:MAG: hypothetical protein AAF581_13860, partial [Planctomycetota bacterium]